MNGGVMKTITKQITITLLRLGDIVGGCSLTTSIQLSEATRNTASPFSFLPPLTTNGVEPNKSVLNECSFGGGGRGGTGGPLMLSKSGASNKFDDGNRTD